MERNDEREDAKVASSCFVRSPPPYFLHIYFLSCNDLSLSGLLCHLDDACVSNPCHEDAICDTNPMNGRAICTCPPGFTGGACDQDVDECSIGENFIFLVQRCSRKIDEWNYDEWNYVIFKKMGGPKGFLR